MTHYPMYPYYSKEDKCYEQPISFPPQHQDRQPGLEYLMDPPPYTKTLPTGVAASLQGRLPLLRAETAASAAP